MRAALVLLALAGLGCESDEVPVLEGAWEVVELDGAEDLETVQDVWADDGQVWAALVRFEGVYDDLGDPTGIPPRSALASFDGAAWTLRDLGEINPIEKVWASGPDDVWLKAISASVLWRGDGETWMEAPAIPDLDSSHIGELWGSTPGVPWVIDDHRVLQLDGDVWLDAGGFADRFSPDRSKVRSQLYIGSFCGASAADQWISGSVQEALPGNADPYDVLIHGDGSGWVVLDEAPRVAPRKMSCAGDSVWGTRTFDEAAPLVRLSGDDWQVVDAPLDGGADESVWIDALLAVADDEAWLLVAHARATSEEESEVVRVDVVRYDGRSFARAEPDEAVPDDFAPRAIAPAEGGGVWLIGPRGVIARFTPEDAP